MKNDRVQRFILNHILECLTIALWIIAAMLTTRFMTVDNILSLLKNASMKGVLAVGMTVVIICGMIDLSVSSTVACTSVVMGLTFKALGMNFGAFIAALIIMVVIAGVMASVHSVFIIKYDMPPMIVTMATMKGLFGIAGLLCNGYPVTTFPQWFSMLGGAKLAFGFPSAAIWFIAMIIVFSIVLNRTKLGRDIYATGGNKEAAHLAGINTVKVRWIALFIVQIAAVFAGIILSAQLRAGNHSYAQDWGMDIICSVIIGGSSFAGGKGKICI